MKIPLILFSLLVSFSFPSFSEETFIGEYKIFSQIPYKKKYRNSNSGLCLTEFIPVDDLTFITKVGLIKKENSLYISFPELEKPIQNIPECLANRCLLFNLEDWQLEPENRIQRKIEFSDFPYKKTAVLTLTPDGSNWILNYESKESILQVFSSSRKLKSDCRLEQINP